jgi:hypothetical protein
VRLGAAVIDCDFGALATIGRQRAIAQIGARGIGKRGSLSRYQSAALLAAPFSPAIRTASADRPRPQGDETTRPTR